MIRVVLFLVTLALIATGFVWFADRPGDVAITWMGYQIETSLMVAALAVAALVVVVMMVWSIARAHLALARAGVAVLPSSPRHEGLSRHFARADRDRLRRHAASRRKSADEAARLSPGDPLTLLLTAQSAQLAGDRIGAERAFHEMARHDNTKLLGLRGLYIEAQRRNDPPAARRVAEEAAKAAASNSTWAGQAVLDDRCANADWAGALERARSHEGRDWTRRTIAASARCC